MVIDLLLADDHQVILDGFTSIFEAVADINVVGTCRNGQQTIEYTNSQKVDVILMDISMPILNGVEACKIIKKEQPGIKIIALSMYDQMSYFKRMMQHGADGYLLKDDSAEEIEKAIRTVHEGEQFISSQLRDRLSSIEFLVGKKDLGATTISARETRGARAAEPGIYRSANWRKIIYFLSHCKDTPKETTAKIRCKKIAQN